MELPIKHKRGTTVPTANDLVVGEIAINTATGLCYTKTGAGNVVAIGLDVAANWGNIGGTLSSQTDLSNALALKADLSGASFSGTVYAPGFRNLLNTDLVIDSYNDTGAGTHYLHKFTPFDGKFVLAPNGGGLTFPDGTTQVTAATTPSLSGYALLSGATFTGKVNTTATATTAPLNIAVATTNPTTTVAGDIWVGMNNIFFKDSINVQRALLNSNTQNTFSAPNTFTGNVVIEGLNNTLPMLRVTQTGIGHALVVEDHTNPDTSAFIVNNTGQVGINKDPSTFGFVLGVGLDVTGKVLTSSTASYAGLNLGSGTAPTVPVQGDIWLAGNTDNLRYRSPLNNLTLEVATRNAVNQFTAGQAITVNSATNALRINQLGTGPALVVEDSTNPDTSSFIVNNAGAVGIGKDPATWVPAGNRKLEVDGAITCSTMAASADSSDVATTAHVKSVIRGQVISDSSDSYSISATVFPNTFIKKQDSGTGNTMTITIESNSTQGIPIGTQFVIAQTGTQQFQIVGNGATIQSAGGKYKSSGQYSVCTLIKVDTDEWYLAGDLTT